MKNKKAVMENLFKWVLWIIVFLALLFAIGVLVKKMIG